MDLAFFADPRFRRERIFLLIALPLTLLILIAAGVTLYFKAIEPPPKPEVLPTPTPYLKTAPDFIKEATLAIQNGDHPAAKDALAKISSDSDKTPAAWEIAGLIKEKEGDPLAAFETYSKGIDAKPSAGLHYRRAILLRNWFNLPASLHEIETANRLHPHDPLYTNERFLTLIALGSGDDLRNQLASLVTTGVNLDASEWIFAVTLIALNNNQFDEAAETLSAAKSSLPPDTFGKLISHPALQPFQNHEKIYQFFIFNKPV